MICRVGSARCRESGVSIDRTQLAIVDHENRGVALKIAKLVPAAGWCLGDEQKVAV